MTTKILTSPNRKIHGQLIEAGKIRFGPPFFELRIEPYDFTGHSFSGRCLWSKDSRFLVMVECLSQDYASGPHTGLYLIDFQRERQCPLIELQGGQLVPIRFHPPYLEFQRRFLGLGWEREYDIDFEAQKTWSPLTKSNDGQQAAPAKPPVADQPPR